MTRLPHPLISADELHRRLDAGELVTLLDVRWVLNGPSQRPAYDEEHIVGAAWVEFEEALTAAPGAGGRHPLPEQDTFEEFMRAAGVRNDTPVVIYDGGNSLAAARCWWLLRYFGHDAVQVLDGGLPAWKAINGSTTAQQAAHEPGDFVAVPGALPTLTAEDALEHAATNVLVDARPTDRFEGRNETIDPVAGHIPGALSYPALSNVADDGRFHSSDDLALRLGTHGITSADNIGVYCGSGVQAMHFALAVEASGLATQPAVYVGSWSEYITDPERPIETGPSSRRRT